MAEDQTEQVMKGGECWLELSIERRIMGVEIWVKTIPKVEEFMEALNPGKSSNALEAFGRSWRSKDPDKPIKARGMDRSIDTVEYELSSVGGALSTTKEAINLSFFRLIGVGSPDGVRFIIESPLTKDEIRKASNRILLASRRFFQDHLAPIHVDLRISSTEV